MSTFRVKNKDGTWDKVPVLGSYQAVLAANEAATNAQNAANAAEKIATDLGLVDEAVQTAVSSAEQASNSAATANEKADVATAKADVATTKASEASTSATTATAKAYAASVSATNAAQSYANADAVATQLTEYLATKETLTAPAVDKTLLIEGAAADSKVVGELKNDLVEISDNYVSFGYSKEVPHTDILGSLINTTNLSIVTASGFSTTELVAKEGDAFIVTSAFGGTVYNPAFATESSVIKQFEIGKEATAPSGTTRLIVNGRPSNNIPITIFKVESNAKSAEFWKEYEVIKSAVEKGFPKYKFGVSVGMNKDIDVFTHQYDDGRDLCVSFWQKASNNLPDFGRFCTYPNVSDDVLTDKTGLSYREINGGGTDYLSPSVVYAKNNVNGDFADFTSGKLTGGWHGYNNATSGATPTARNVSCKVFCDGREVSIGEQVRGNDVVIDIVNRLQGSNTEKSDGSGREIVEQHITIRFYDDFTVKVDCEITALEDIVYRMHYGISSYLAAGKPIHFVGCRTKRNPQIPSSAVNRCGDKNCTEIRQYCDYDVFSMGFDASHDLGTLYANDWVHSCIMGSGKAYMVLVYNEGTTENDGLSLNANDKVYWRGFYRCRPL